MTIEMVVFDMAGTTVDDLDDAVARAVCDALRNAGVAVTIHAVDPVMGIPKPRAIRLLLADARGHAPADTEDAEVARIHDDFRRRIVDHYRTAPGVAERPGATTLFRELKSRGVRIALDTGFDRLTLNAIVDRLGWHDEIDDTVASDEVAAGRPAPNMIHTLMRRAGIGDAQTVAKVGDSVSDLQEGLNAGCGLVVAIRNDRTVPALPDFPAVRAIDHLDEIPLLLTPTHQRDHEPAQPQPLRSARGS